jgi:hypothetical protein
MKEAAAENLVNWADADNDNDFKHRINRDFTRPDVRRRKMTELRRIKQNNESVEDYTRRFRNILRIATRGQPLQQNEYQVDFYIEGLEPTIGYNVRRQNPANLNDAVNQARREEEAKNELIRKTTGIDIGLDREKRMEEILREETGHQEISETDAHQINIRNLMNINKCIVHRTF